MTVGRNDPCPCGSGSKYKKCCQNKARAEVFPALSAADRLARAAAFYQAGQLDEAMALCQQLLARGECLAEARHLHGVLLLSQGDPTGALSAFDAASRLSNDPRINSNRGLALARLSRHAEAVQAFQASVRSDPRQFLVWMNLANAQRSLGDLAQAEQSYLKVLALMPDFPDALSALARVVLDQQRPEEALDVLYSAESRSIRSADLLAVKGLVMTALNRSEEALEAYRDATLSYPNDAHAHSRLGVVLRERCMMEPALQAFARAYEVEPTLEAALDLHLSLPPVLRSREEMQRWRRRFTEGIETLASSGRTARVSESMFIPSMFYLAFHGEDDRPIMEALSRMYRQLLPDLAYTAAHIGADHRGDDTTRRPRIAFFSKFIHTHSVSRCFSQLIRKLGESSACDLILTSPQRMDSESAQANYGNFPGQFVHMSDDFFVARQTLADLRLDALVYLDIGMEAMSYFMAHARLAPVQLVMCGHPVTTGISTVDYYFSSALAEPQDGHAHYSEALLLMSALNSVYLHPLVPPVMKGRREFGLPETGALYVCPMLLQKIHPDFDEAVGRLLEADPGSHIVFFESKSQNWQQVLKERFDVSVPASVRDRVIFLPWQSNYDDFMAANAVADVVLDPFHFGIGSTAAATFAVQTPIVTLPGTYMRGRGGLTYALLLDVPECVASSVEDYVRRAMALAHDADLRRAVRERLVANKARFFGNEEPVNELAAHLLRLTQPTHLSCATP